jgi:hypothetical protein
VEKKFSVYQDGELVAGLQKVSSNNANLTMLVSEVSLDTLEVEKFSWAYDKFGNKYFIIRDC